MSWILAPWLLAQGAWVRRRIPVLPEAHGPREGRHGEAGAIRRVLLAGDSSAAGVGVDHQDRAFAGHFVRSLQRLTGGTLHWQLRARSGLTTRQLDAWLRSEPPAAADLAVILTGVNDVIDRIGVPQALQHRAALVDWLLGPGRVGAVLFAPLPPIEQFPALPQPLRRVMGAQARRHDDALSRWSEQHPRVFHTRIDVQLTAAQMAPDGFHPGEPVYRRVGTELARYAFDNIDFKETRS